MNNLRFPNPEREKTNKETVVISDLVNALAAVNQDLIRFDNCRETQIATQVCRAIDKLIAQAEMFKWRVRDEQCIINRGRPRKQVQRR